MAGGVSWLPLAGLGIMWAACLVPRTVFVTHFSR